MNALICFSAFNTMIHLYVLIAMIALNELNVLLQQIALYILYMLIRSII